MFLTHSDKVKVVIPLNLKSGSFIVMFWVAQNNYPNYRSEHDLEFQGIVSTKVYLQIQSKKMEQISRIEKQNASFVVF